MTEATGAAFDTLCAALPGTSRTLAQLGDCHALARQWSGQEPRDEERIAQLAKRLGIDIDRAIRRPEAAA